MEAELLDWELVHGSDSESIDSIASDKKPESSAVIDDGMILSDHFSPDSISSPITDQSMESGDSSRVDYGSEGPSPVKLGFDELSDTCVGNELGLSDGEVRVSDFESHVEDATQCLSETDNLQVGVELVSGDSDGETVGGNDDVDTVVRHDDESKRIETVWWKMPLVLVKYCAFKIGPIWSVSMTAALIGFLLLGRRLYNRKKKPQMIRLKVAMDYKKVSRVMNQAARLNEAFTEVKRVPVIRPALPSPGTWPVLSLR